VNKIVTGFIISFISFYVTASKHSILIPQHVRSQHVHSYCGYECDMDGKGDLYTVFDSERKCLKVITTTKIKKEFFSLVNGNNSKYALERSACMDRKGKYTLAMAHNKNDERYECLIFNLDRNKGKRISLADKENISQSAHSRFIFSSRSPHKIRMNSSTNTILFYTANGIELRDLSDGKHKKTIPVETGDRNWVWDIILGSKNIFILKSNGRIEMFDYSGCKQKEICFKSINPRCSDRYEIALSNDERYVSRMKKSGSRVAYSIVRVFDLVKNCEWDHLTFRLSGMKRFGAFKNCNQFVFLDTNSIRKLDFEKLKEIQKKNTK